MSCIIIILFLHGLSSVTDVSKGRWAEIRAASTPTSTSTWDHIRQAHERPKERQLQQSDIDDRQTEQAKFDALLEAERKMSS